MKNAATKQKKAFVRLEDSLSRPENQRRRVEDPYVEKQEQRLIEKLRKRAGRSVEMHSLALGAGLFLINSSGII